MTRQELVQREIWALRQAVPEIKGVMVASTDGLSVATDFPEALGARVAAMAAAVFALGKRINHTLDVGGLEEMAVRGRTDYLVVYAAGDGAVLAVEAPKEVNLGLLHLEARAAAARIAEVLATTSLAQAQGSNG